MKKLIIVSFFSMWMVNSFAQNNAAINQYMFAGIILNPAYAGTHSYLDAQLMHRNQWVQIDGAPETNFISVHGPWKGKNRHIGSGLSIQHDKFGNNSQTEFSAMYSYKIKLEPGKMAFGLRGGFFNQTVGAQSETLFDDGDSEFGGKSSDMYVNFGTGMYYYTKQYYAGLSTQRLVTYGGPNGYEGNSDNRQFSERVTYLYGGYVFDINQNLKLKPNSLLRYSRRSPLSVDVNLNALIKDWFWLGGSYKINQGWAVLFQLEVLRPVKFGYAYDVRTTQQSSGYLSSHEFMISYDFGKKLLVQRNVAFF